MLESAQEKIRRHISTFYMNFTIPIFQFLHGGRILVL